MNRSFQRFTLWFGLLLSFFLLAVSNGAPGWLAANAMGLGLAALGVFLAGFAAYQLSKRRRLSRLMLGLIEGDRPGRRRLFRQYRQGRLKNVKGLFLKWAGCVKCSGFWFGAAVALPAGLLLSLSAAGALYFSLLGGLAGSVVAMAAALRANRS